MRRPRLLRGRHHVQRKAACGAARIRVWGLAGELTAAAAIPCCTGTSHIRSVILHNVAPGTTAVAGQPRRKVAAARRLDSGPRCEASGASTARQPDASAAATQAASGGVTAHLCMMNTAHGNCIGKLLEEVIPAKQLQQADQPCAVLLRQPEPLGGAVTRAASYRQRHAVAVAGPLPAAAQRVQPVTVIGSGQDVVPVHASG